jgi:hypothetical protein
MKEFKKIFNEDNKTLLIGLLSIIIFFWIILYIIPGFLISLFNTFLGNIILLISLVLVSSQEPKYGIALAIIFIILYRFSHLKEGFTWSQESEQKFIELQNSINPQNVFDLKQIKQQASQNDVDYFLKNGQWFWCKEDEDLYKELLDQNPYVRLYSRDAINDAKTKYNQTIIKEILSSQLDALQQNENNNSEILDKNKDDRDGLGSYSFTSGLEPVL